MEEKVTELIQALTKAIKALQLYGINHPSFVNFYTPLYERLANFLKNYNELNFQVERFTLLFGQRVVYEEEEKDINIAFRLFRDGIRSLGFTEGLESGELLRFLEIITLPTKDQDIVLSLWESDFTHINFYVVEEEDENIDYKVPQVPIDNVDYDAKINEMIYRERIDLSEPITTELKFDELKNLKTEIQKNGAGYSLPLTITTLISYLNIERSDEVIDSLTLLLERCVELRDFANARRIVHNLMRFTKTSGIEKFENETTVLGFKSLLDIPEDEVFNEFIAFIGFFSSKSVPHFLKMIATMRREDRLDALRHRLAYIAQDDISPLAKFLKNEDAAIVANAVAILGIMKHRDTVNLVKPLIHHPDPKVRVEVVTCLGNVEELTVITQFIDDPSLEVRIKALNTMTDVRFPRIYQEILRRISQKQFFDRDFSEQKAYFNYLVANGGENLVKYLRKTLFHWQIFGRKRYRIMRKLAAAALAQINSEESLGTLRQGLKRRNKDIRAACEMALKGK